ncbi:MAG: HEAT repeat domain-containing protein [Planctomycetota bacterium]
MRRTPLSAFRVGLSMAALPEFAAVEEQALEAKDARGALGLALGEDAPPGAERLVLAGSAGTALRSLFLAIASMRICLSKNWAAALPSGDRAKVLAELASVWTSDPDGRSLATILETARKLDPRVFANHVVGALKMIEEAITGFSALKHAELPQRVHAPGTEGDVRLYLPTRMGPILIGGPGPTRYEGDAFVIVDFGGDDTYRGRVASASFGMDRPVSILIDLGGDDSYIGSESVNQGAALLGVGILLDLGGGSDRYEARDVAQGAAVLGLGLLYDDGGDDSYHARGLVQGAASFGFGILADLEGNDRFDAGRFAQGFGGVRGYGALLDGSGHDVYHAGGVFPHRPLHADRCQSMSQGFGLGLRSRGASGGIGFIWDGAGNDYYLTDIYGQGAGYWMALGALIDESGNDTYVCGQYGQGAGIHLAAGGLWDLAGDDSYTLVHGVGQGGGHDLAVGFLMEGAGNDYYQGSGLTQGSGGSNSVGICLDLEGDDGYSGIRVQGEVQHQGYGKPARGYGSIGLLLDLAGEDSFSHRDARDGKESWPRGQWGLTWDRGAAEETDARASEATDAKQMALPNPLPLPSDENLARLFASASLWEVGDNVRLVRRARATLVAIGKPAGLWILKHRMDATETLGLRAIRAVLVPLGKELLPELRALLGDEIPAKRGNAMDLLWRLRDHDSVPAIVAILMKDPLLSLRRKAALALCRLGARGALPGLDRLARSTRAEDRRAAAVALRGIPGAQAVHRLVDLLADESFTVRDPARASLDARREEAEKLGLVELGRVKGPVLREWLRLFAKWKVQASREVLEGLRESRDEWVREQAQAILGSLEAHDPGPTGRE